MKEKDTFVTDGIFENENPEQFCQMTWQVI